MQALCDAPTISRTERKVITQILCDERSSLASYVSQTVLQTMPLSALIERCKRELSNFRNGRQTDERYGLEMFRRVRNNDQDAWIGLQYCFSDNILIWLYRHPSKETALQLESEENYVAMAFERFWRAAVHRHTLEFTTLAAALEYLHASLNGAILDTLRSHTRRREVALPEPGFQDEPYVEDVEEYSELWDMLRRMFPDVKDLRVVYLLFHCGLKPREIVQYCPREFASVQEVYRIRRNIMERLTRNADQIRRRLGIEIAA